jgi:hypothetical protein
MQMLLSTTNREASATGVGRRRHRRPCKDSSLFLNPSTKRESIDCKNWGFLSPTRTAPPTRFRFFDGIGDLDMTWLLGSLPRR